MALTRADIVRAATRLAGEKGASALSMRSIARELGVSPMALYNHIADREDLISAIVESFLGYALTGESDMSARAHRFFDGLRQWPYMVSLIREAASRVRLVQVDEMLADFPAEQRSRLEADWLALGELALGLVDAESAGRAGAVDIAQVFARAAEAILRV